MARRDSIRSTGLKKYFGKIGLSYEMFSSMCDKRMSTRSIAMFFSISEARASKYRTIHEMEKEEAK